MLNRKSPRIAAFLHSHQGQPIDAHYLGFFECFNAQRYFEAHEVLEELWLQDRHGLNGDFFKGLIQLAGAFVHLQKGRKGPATALFSLAAKNLGKYPAFHEHLDVERVRGLIGDWLRRLPENNGSVQLLLPENAPRITLSQTAR